MSSTGTDLDAVRSRGLRYEYATIAWNAFEGATAIVAGVLAHSVALTAFGLDSSVEVFASSVAAWQLRGGRREHESIALRLIGGCFLLVGAYIGYDSVLHLVMRRRAGTSVPGVVLTAAALVIMTFLGLAKRGIGRDLGSKVLVAEAKFSLVDAALSGTVLLGLVLNLALRWWWADPAVAVALAAYSLSEGVAGLRAAPESER